MQVIKLIVGLCMLAPLVFVWAFIHGVHNGLKQTRQMIIWVLVSDKEEIAQGIAKMKRMKHGRN